jgi:hypothetical protein
MRSSHGDLVQALVELLNMFLHELCVGISFIVI